MQVLAQGNMLHLLDPIVRKVFWDTYNEMPSIMPQLYTVVQSRRSKERDFGMGSIGTFEEFTGTLEYDTFEGLWAKDYVHVEYAKGLEIRRKDLDDDLHNVLIRKPRELAIAAARTREVHAASVFNNAFSSSYPGGDDQPLCSSSHPLSPSNASTLDNAGTDKLSHTAYETARLAMRSWTDDRGNKLVVQPDTLLVPPALEETAFIITNADRVPGSANWDKSIIGSRPPRVIVWDYLTSSTAWFLIDSRLMKQYLLWFERVPLEFDSEQDFDTLARRWRAYMRYSYGFSEWRWVYGSTGV